jgi:hypothetical protein
MRTRPTIFAYLVIIQNDSLDLPPDPPLLPASGFPTRTSLLDPLLPPKSDRSITAEHFTSSPWRDVNPPGPAGHLRNSAWTRLGTPARAGFVDHSPVGCERTQCCQNEADERGVYEGGSDFVPFEGAGDDELERMGWGAGWKERRGFEH